MVGEAGSVSGTELTGSFLEAGSARTGNGDSVVALATSAPATRDFATLLLTMFLCVPYGQTPDAVVVFASERFNVGL